MAKRFRAALLSAIALSAALAAVSCGIDKRTYPISYEFPDEESRPVLGEEWDRAKDADVYIVGLCNRVFKNGVTTPLGGVPKFMRANSVFVSDGHVYVAGQAQEQMPGSPNGVNYAVLWKDGVPQRLGAQATRAADDSMANSVFVSGGHVYVAGYEQAPNPDDGGRMDRMPTLWVDGVPRHLRTGDIYGGDANCVFVSGDDVYVGGKVDFEGHIWKNGVRQPPLYAGGGGQQTQIRSIFVDGDNVYAVGTDYVGRSRAVFFKNGVGQALTYGAAWSVFVEGGVVYVAGSERNYEPHPTIESPYRSWAVLWKDGVKQRLTEGADSYASIYSVSVLNGDVYLAGYEETTIGRAYPPYVSYIWINGEAVDLKPSGFHDDPLSVFVVEKGK